MRKLMLKLWNDDAGIVALEYLLVATIVGLGMVVGLAALEKALNAELTELGNAITSIDQSYAIVGQQSRGAITGSIFGSKRGWSAVDTPNNAINTLTGPEFSVSVDVVP